MKTEMKMFAIYDRIAEESSAPFLARTEGVAVRIYLDAIKSQAPSAIQDYWLYSLGVYDTETMELTPKEKASRVKPSEGLEMEAVNE